jgi:hypothetical protein
MKTSRIIILILAAVALVLTIVPAVAGQKSEPGVAVPKYDRAAEATFKGTVAGGKRPSVPGYRWYGLTPDLEIVSQQYD